MLRIRNNGTVLKIDSDPVKLEKAQKIVNSNNVSDTVKNDLIKNLPNGRCCLCENIATHKLLIDVSDEKHATRVERYCETCLKTVYERKNS